jgi:hypothetical protein
MAICGCGSSAHYCQPAIAGGFIYADLRSELNTHLAPQALFTQSSVHDATATSFPLSKHTGGGDTAPAFSDRHVYLQFTWEVVFPPLLWSVPPTAAFTSFLPADCWACAATSAFSTRFVVRDFPSLLLQCSGRPTLFAMCLFCCYCLLFSFSFFPWVGGQSVQWAMPIWPRIVCGSTAFCLAHLVVRVFPSLLGTGIWLWCGSPPGFSI